MPSTWGIGFQITDLETITGSQPNSVYAFVFDAGSCQVGGGGGGIKAHRGTQSRSIATPYSNFSMH